MPNINIRWEDKHYYNNTSSTSYGNPVTALVSYGPDGRPSKSCLTKAGIEHFYGKEEAAPAPTRKSDAKSSGKSSSNSSSNSKSKSSSSSRSSSSSGSGALSADERYWLDLSLSSHEDEMPHIYLRNVFNHYIEVIKLRPQRDSEYERKEEKIKEFSRFMKRFPVPDNPVEFLLTSAVIDEAWSKADDEENFLSSGPDSDIFGSGTIRRRINDIVNDEENTDGNPLYSQELIDIIWSLGDNYKEIVGKRAYRVVAKNHCKQIYDEGGNVALEKLIKLYEKNRAFSDDYLKKMPIPNSNKEEFLEAFRIINSSKRQNYVINNKLSQLKEIILANYSDDAKLMEFVSAQVERELRDTAGYYRMIKWLLSFLPCLLLSFSVIPLIPIIIWGLLFYVPFLHNMIPALKRGKEAIKKLKELDAEKKNKALK